VKRKHDGEMKGIQKNSKPDDRQSVFKSNAKHSSNNLYYYNVCQEESGGAWEAWNRVARQSTFQEFAQ